jgi:penicillin-binding protein 2
MPVTYRSPYSARNMRRAQRPPLWPKILAGVIVVLLLAAGGVALYASGMRINISRGITTATATAAPAAGIPAGGTPTASTGTAGTAAVSVGNSGSGAAVPPTAIPLGGTPAAGTPGRPGSATPAGALNASDPRSVAQAYADRWGNKDYSGMYDLIGAAEKAGITREKFTARYQAIAEEAGLAEVKAAIGDAPSGATQLPLRVQMQSSLVGPITEDNTLTMRQEPDGWRVAWTPSLIFKDLGDGLIRFKPDLPTRGRILDSKGRPLAQQGLVTLVGIVPKEIKDEPNFLAGLSKALGLPPEKIKAQYATADPSWFVPIKTLPEQIPAEMNAAFQTLPGLVVRKVPGRVYPQGTLAAHIVGYVGEINADELKDLAPKGYIIGDKIGRSGVEAWGEQWLAGRKGGQLTVVSQSEAVRKVIAERKSEPAADVTLTVDIDLQRALEEGLGDRAASGVIMDPTSGAIIAMGSHPTYDPNGFTLGFDDAAQARLNDEALRPLWDRATQFTYPSGSIFKVITATAGVTKLGMNAKTIIPCPAQFSLPGAPNVWKDWTYPQAQGNLTLQNSITQSCNTVFYEIGRQLDDLDENALPEVARAFGLGKPTGLEELPEAAGVVPDAAWKRQNLNDGWSTGDAVNLAIGQGFFLTSPLQMANMYNAIANGGTLLRPFLAAKVATPDGKILHNGLRKEIGKLPVPPDAMQMIHTGMKNVTSAPNGTAIDAFVGVPIPVAGKTGTAEVPPKPDHAWFASFAPADAPKLTIVSMVENGGRGSKIAAPIARHVYDVYATLAP